MKQQRARPALEPGLSPRAQLEQLLNAKICAALSLGEAHKKLLANLLAAAASYPTLMNSLRELYSDGLDELAQQAEQPGLALAIRSALDGLLLLEILNIRQFSAQEKLQLRSTLLETFLAPLRAPDAG